MKFLCTRKVPPRPLLVLFRNYYFPSHGKMQAKPAEPLEPTQGTLSIPNVDVLASGWDTCCRGCGRPLWDFPFSFPEKRDLSGAQSKSADPGPGHFNVLCCHVTLGADATTVNPSAD